MAASPTTRRCCGSPTSRRELIAPGSFLPAAERYGLIREIDRMVLEKVAALLGARARLGRRVASRSTCPRCRSPTPRMLAYLERQLTLHGSTRRCW